MAYLHAWRLQAALAEAALTAARTKATGLADEVATLREALDRCSHEKQKALQVRIRSKIGCIVFLGVRQSTLPTGTVSMPLYMGMICSIEKLTIEYIPTLR